MPRILLVEDDRQLVETLQRIAAYENDCTLKAIENAPLVKETVLSWKPDIILLDINLPGGDGREILKQLKADPETAGIPVIFLTGTSTAGDKKFGLDMGADDYVAKPFDPMELIARVRAVLRRCPPAVSEDKVEIAGLRMDKAARTAEIAGKPLVLQPKEFDMLFLLASSPGRVHSRAFLAENSSSAGPESSLRSVDTHVKNIRTKLGKRARLIGTVPKFGYKFDSKA
ncbi:MAG: response regulator transcription factor [bacterium]